MTQTGPKSPRGGSFGLNSVRMKLIRESRIDYNRMIIHFWLDWPLFSPEAALKFIKRFEFEYCDLGFICNLDFEIGNLFDANLFNKVK